MSRCLPLPSPRRKTTKMEFKARFQRKNKSLLPLPSLKQKASPSPSLRSKTFLSNSTTPITSTSGSKTQNLLIPEADDTAPPPPPKITSNIMLNAPSPVPVPIPSNKMSSHMVSDNDAFVSPKLVLSSMPAPSHTPTPSQAPDTFCGKVHDVLIGTRREIMCYDDMGFVSLIDVAPRLCPEGRGIDFAAARSARVSYGSDLRTPEQDRALVRYLILNRHTSPLEFISFTFRIRCPIFVARHIMRHRTTSINEVSARYTVLPNDCFTLKDVRVNNKLNKQSSGSSLGDVKSQEEEDKAREIHAEACRKSMEAYTGLIELGVARELARTVLPCGTFTDFYININLNNFLKFLGLRMADDAQAETREIANAMFELCRPLSPAIFDTHSSMDGGLFLTESDINSILKKSSSLVGARTGRKEKVEYVEKLKRMDINF